MDPLVISSTDPPWLSCIKPPKIFPLSLSHSQSIRASVLHSLTEVAGDIVSCSSRPEWLPLLHHVAMLHATVRLRRSTYPQAWAKEYPWKHTQLMVSSVQSHNVTQCYTMLHK